MPGLVPGIHVLKSMTAAKDVDGRDKPGHDDYGELRELEYERFVEIRHRGLWRDRVHRPARRRISRRAVWQRQAVEMDDGRAQPRQAQIRSRRDRRARRHAADRG